MKGKKVRRRHAVSKFRRTVRVEITIKDRKRGKMAEEFRTEKICP